MKKLFGVTTAMVTPFFEDGTVDLKAVAALTELLIQKGVHGLYPCGTTGEMLRMSVEERKQVAETVIKTAAGRVLVYVHCGAATQNDTMELMQHAEAIGADGVGVVTPQFFGLNDRAMEEYYVTLASCVSPDFPIYLYCIPQCAANDISVNVAERIAARCPNIIGLKYSYSDINRTLDYLRVRNGDFAVMHGCDRVMIAMMALGCDGSVSGCSSAFPEPFVAAYEAWKRGNLEEARMHQLQAARVVDILTVGGDLSRLKETLKLRGINGGHMKKPLLDMPEEEIAVLKAELERFCADTGYVLQV